MAQQTIVVTCPACFNDFEILNFDTQTNLTLADTNGEQIKTLRISIIGSIDHEDCSATPA